MSFEPRDYLRHILVEADYLIGRSEGLSFESFSADETLRRAFVRTWRSSEKPPRKCPRISARAILPSNGAPWPECATS